MSKFNIFDHAIPEKYKKQHESDKAQSEALIEASNIVYQAMKEKKINQIELAKQLGVSRGYVSRILSGNENMSIKNVARILHELGKKYIQYTINIIDDTKKCKIYDFESYQKNENDLDYTAKAVHTEYKTIETWSN